MALCRAGLGLLGLSYLGFVGIGLPDGVLGVAWPSIREGFGIPIDALGALLVSTTLGYVVASALAGRILATVNLGALLAFSCLATAASLGGYAGAPSWSFLVALGTLTGLGAGAIDAGLNTYVATHHSARMLSLLHAFYGLGTMIGPLLMARMLVAGHPWRAGFALIALAQLLLAIAFAATRRRWPAPPRDDDSLRPSARVPIRSTLALPSAWFGVTAFFLYVGIEAAAGAWTYTLLHQGRGVSVAWAGAAVSVFWGGLMLGRIVFALGPWSDALHRSLRFALGGVGIAAALVAVDLGDVATAGAVLLLGMACGPVFPALIASTPLRCGERHAGNAIGFQVAAGAVGQSLLPACFGVLAAREGLESVPRAIFLTAVALFAVHELMSRTASPEA